MLKKILLNLLILLCIQSNCIAEPLAIRADGNTLLLLERMSFSGLNLDIPNEVLNSFQDSPILFETMLRKHSIYTYSASIKSNKDDWKELYNILLEKPWVGQEDSWGAAYTSTVQINMLTNLFANAKSILRSFLVTDSEKLRTLEQTYFKKEGYTHRLFTYAHLQKIIEKNELSHVHLPHKFLAVYNKDTNSYISGEQAFEILNNIITMQLSGTRVQINDTDSELNSHYGLVIFAQKITKTKTPLNEAAKQELHTLCGEAPFDIGYDNIFSDSNGDAIIIDTEAKGTNARDCGKIGRYK